MLAVVPTEVLDDPIDFVDKTGQQPNFSTESPCQSAHPWNYVVGSFLAIGGLGFGVAAVFTLVGAFGGIPETGGLRLLELTALGGENYCSCSGHWCRFRSVSVLATPSLAPTLFVCLLGLVSMAVIVSATTTSAVMMRRRPETASRRR